MCLHVEIDSQMGVAQLYTSGIVALSKPFYKTSRSVRMRSDNMISLASTYHGIVATRGKLNPQGSHLCVLVVHVTHIP